MLTTSSFDYHLPEELIAQYPADKRDHSRMLVLDRKSGDCQILPFGAIVDFIHPGDVLIYNNTKVLRGRMFARKNGETDGAKFEILLVERLADGCWIAMVRPGKRAMPGTRAVLMTREGAVNDCGDGFEVVSKNSDGTVNLRFFGADVDVLQSRYGHIPLPPYISREDSAEDAERYQTVYAETPGAVAAPTAGLHFTAEIMAELKAHGVNESALTLHVGPGTFKPVSSEKIEEHKMHSEEYFLSAETADLINATHAAGKRVFAVGTTTVRVLESCINAQNQIIPGHGRTEIFLYPPKQLHSIDALLTNFHLPKSTLLMLVSCLCDREKVLNAYEYAIRNKMRFYSYGDCMLLI